MSKQLKYIIITVICAVLLAGVLLIILNIPEKAPEAPAKTPENLTALIDLKQADVASVELQNKQGSMKLLPLADTTDFYVDGYKDLPVSASDLYSIVTAALSFTSSQEVDKLDKTVATYGLNDPAATVTVTPKSGAAQTFVIGDATPLGNGFYGYVLGSDTVHVFKPAVDKLRTVNLLEMVDKNLIPRIDEKKITDITRITLGGSARAEEVVIAPLTEQDEKSTLAYQVVLPKKHEVDSTFLSDGIFTAFNGLTADAVVVVKATEEDKNLYGITQAPYTFQWVYEGKTAALTFGKTEGTDIYVMRPDRMSIYKVALSKVKAVTAPLSEINSSFLALRFIDTVEVLSLKVDGKTYDFSFTGDIANDDMKVFYQDKEVDIEAVREVYSAVIGLKYQGEAAPVTAPSVLTVTFRLRDGKGTQTMEFFEIDARKCYVKMDGADTGRYVFKKDVDSVAAKLQTLLDQIGQ